MTPSPPPPECGCALAHEEVIYGEWDTSLNPKACRLPTALARVERALAEAKEEYSAYDSGRESAFEEVAVWLRGGPE